MVLITEELIRKRSEHNECVISTLEEVALHQEDIEKIEHIQNWCRDLKILLLQSNLISRIENLNKLKKLEYINLALNNIELIENLEGCESLQKLDLTLNFIGDLESVEKLKGNKHLKHLYLTGNPCSDYDGYRDFVIATLPQLDSLDSVHIERSDRIKALQAYSLVKPRIVAEQIAYRKKREQQKKVAQDKKLSCESSSTTTVEDDEKFWNEMSDNTPETRIELARHSKRSQQNTTEKKDDKSRPQINLFNSDGKPRNINEAKIPFTFEEDEKRNCFVLTLKIYKYLDTSLLLVDLQPEYVTVRIKGKVFQLTLSEDVKISESSTQRSQTTGYLVITMPKERGEVKAKAQPPVDLSEKNKICSNNISKREYLEIGMEKNELDFSKILESNKDKQNTHSIRRQIMEKIPSRDFLDDPSVPPLI